MSLRVDLILETEQRSATVVNKKSLLRLSAIVIPLALAAVVIREATIMINLASDLKSKEADWAILGPRETQAKSLAQDCQTHGDILKELEGWSKSHVEWHPQLLGLLREVPPTIQIRTLKVDQTLVGDTKPPARTFTMTLKGKAVGKDAEANVKLLERRLREVSAFAAVITNAQVRQFGADPAKDAKKDDRLFEIVCGYREFKFE